MCKFIQISQKEIKEKIIYLDKVFDILFDEHNDFSTKQKILIMSAKQDWIKVKKSLVKIFEIN